VLKIRNIRKETYTNNKEETLEICKTRMASCNRIGANWNSWIRGKMVRENI
jgi:hypothetical protein